MITFDTGELSSLAVDLGKVGFRTTGTMLKIFRESGDDLVDVWAANARTTSGTHGRLYPESIDAEVQISTDIVVEVGPNPSKPQGKMAFETGSVNQPPHPDGQRAADAVSKRLNARIDVALRDLGI